MNSQELKNGLTEFYGTTVWYRHGLNRNMLYTEGVQFFAENAGNGAYWFLDIVATEVFKLQADESFISLHLDVSDKSDCKIVADDGNGNVIYERDLEFTDCPPGKWSFFLTDNTLLLPSEY